MLSKTTSRVLQPRLMCSLSINSKRFLEKGQERVAGRLDGIWPPDAKMVDKGTKEWYDEEGNFNPPDSSKFPHIPRKACLMNIRIPPLGIEPPPFGAEQYKEIESKTTITKEGVDWVRKHWTDESIPPDAKDYQTIADDICEMEQKGVSYETMCLWLDYVSGADKNSPYQVVNRSWAKINQ